MVKVVVHTALHRQEVAERAPKSAFTMLKPGWWEAREKMFRKYFLASMAAQTYQGFDMFLTVRHQDDTPENPLLRTAREAGCHVASRPYVPCRYPLAPNYFGAVCDLWGKENNGIMLVSLDSDDCLHRKALAELAALDFPSDLNTVYWDIGYAYCPDDGRLVEYGVENFPGPFYARYFPKQALSCSKALLSYLGDNDLQIWHYQAPGRHPSMRMHGGRFIQLLHSSNTTSGWDDPHTKKRIRRDVPPDQVPDVLARFGVKP